jgi:hypothetical protein
MGKELLGRIIPTFTFILGMGTMYLINKQDKIVKVIKQQMVEYKTDTAKLIKNGNKLELSGVTGTYYHPVAAQCDATPLETADGSMINLKKLKNHKLKWVALSRDLLSSKDSRIKGHWVVRDSMNKRFKKRIDFLVHQSHKFPGKTRNLTLTKDDTTS